MNLCSVAHWESPPRTLWFRKSETDSCTLIRLILTQRLCWSSPCWFCYAETEPALAWKCAVECTERNCRAGGLSTGSLLCLSMPSLSQDAVILWRRCVFTARWMENEAGELHLHELWDFGFLLVCFLRPLTSFCLYEFVCFIFVRRRLHLKWLCILKVPAMGDDNHWNGKWLELLEGKERKKKNGLCVDCCWREF